MHNEVQGAAFGYLASILAFALFFFSFSLPLFPLSLHFYLLLTFLCHFLLSLSSPLSS